MAEKKTTSSKGAGKSEYVGTLAPLEKSIDEVVKKAPQIPENGRRAIAQWTPWISLVIGLLGLLSALSLWRAAHRVNELVDWANQLSAAYGTQSVAPQLGVTFWLSIILLIVTSVILLVAFPALKARKKSGWNLLFYSALINFAYGIVSLFYDGGGFSSLLGALVGTAIGLYFLFQIRDHYKA